MEDRIEKGKKVTAVAIAKADPIALQKCLNQFRGIAAGIDDIAAAITECPISLLEKAGFCLTITSGVAGRDITLGRDVSWQAVKGFLSGEADRAAVAQALEAQGLFGGKVVCCETLLPGDGGGNDKE